MLDELEDPAHLADSRLLAAYVLDADAEVCVVRVDDRLADPRVDVERPEKEQEVRAEQEEEVDELREDLGEQGRQRQDGVLGGQPEDVEHRNEVEDRDGSDEESTAPENRAICLDGALHRVRLRRQPLVDDQPAAHHAQNAAGKQHREHRVGQRPADPQLERDESKGERSCADEEREDPEDDHGGVNSLYVLGLRSR